MKIIIPAGLLLGTATEPKPQSSVLLVLQGLDVYYLSIFATQLPSPRIDSARFIEDLTETPPECTFPLLGIGRNEQVGWKDSYE